MSAENTFSALGLHERLLKAIEQQRFDSPTAVQSAAIPAALGGRDLLMSAETGSGKTAAFLLPTLHRLLSSDTPSSGTRALILLPTRELARQVMKHFTDLANFTHLKAGLITGGADLKYQRAIIRKNPEVIIATPGRLAEHLSHQNLALDDLEVLILDEADRMLDLGLSDDVLKIAAACSAKRQTLLISATLNHKGVSGVAKSVLHEPDKVILNAVRQEHAAIHQQIVLADDVKHKQLLLARLLVQQSFDKALVFTNTRDQATSLCGLLQYQKVRCGVLHGEIAQDERNRVMDLLRRGHIDVLVCTDVAARGLDVKGVDLVVNFDFARSGDEHLHRVGRTGRAGALGLAISMVTANEWNLMAGIERYLKIKFERRGVEGLEGKFKGPKKLKASGKAAGVKKKTTSKKSASGAKKGARSDDKVKQRHRDQKSVGKRRKPSAAAAPSNSGLGDGFAPFTKRKED